MSTGRIIIAIVIFVGIQFLILSCTNKTSSNYPDLSITGAMKNVMWKGELKGIISLDSIANTDGLYGLGPEEFLTGELLINNGKTYVSKVINDSTMIVEETNKVKAPFFVSTNVREWIKTKLPDSIKNIKDLEQFIDKISAKMKRPFAFKLTGSINKGVIHIQNLPLGTKVSSPKEAHLGQVNYSLEKENVEIIGFFSTDHKGIFTHHDSFLHMHLITKDKSKMGHLDKVSFDKMTLFLPKL